MRGVLKLLHGQHPDMKVGITCCAIFCSDGMVQVLRLQSIVPEKELYLFRNAGYKCRSSCAKGASAEWGHNPQQQSAQWRSAR